MSYRNEPEFKDFVEYNDLGLPLAYAVSADIVKATELSNKFILETWDILLEALKVEDEGYATLDDLLLRAEDIQSEEE